MKIGNVVSTFDGCSCGQEALIRAGIEYDNYYASEINKDAIRVTMKNFPNTIQLGDIRKIDTSKLKNVDLVIGGSPCTNLSIMGKMEGLSTWDDVHVDSLEKYLQLKNDGYSFKGESYLFWELVRIIRALNPKYVLIENVKMKKYWQNVFTEALGFQPILINSSLLSAQNRERLYWTNIPNVRIPEDKGIMFDHIIPGAKSAGKRGKGTKGNYQYPMTIRKDGKGNCVVTSPHTTNCYITENGEYKRMTPDEAEILQTMRPGFTYLNDISISSRYKMIGNAWTIDVISHLFQGIKQNK